MRRDGKAAVSRAATRKTASRSAPTSAGLETNRRTIRPVAGFITSRRFVAALVALAGREPHSQTLLRQCRTMQAVVAGHNALSSPARGFRAGTAVSPEQTTRHGGMGRGDHRPQGALGRPNASTRVPGGTYPSVVQRLKRALFNVLNGWRREARDESRRHGGPVRDAPISPIRLVYYGVRQRYVPCTAAPCASWSAFHHCRVFNGLAGQADLTHAWQ